MAISADAMPGIQKLYQADSRTGKPRVDKIAPEKPRGPTFYRRELMVTGREEAKTGKWPFRKETFETVEFNFEQKERYRKFLAYHVQKLTRLQEKNPQILEDPIHAHEKKMLQLFVGEAGKVDMQKINSYLEQPEGWITTTQLFEEQISLGLFTLGMRAEAMTEYQRNIMINKALESFSGDNWLVARWKNMMSPDNRTNQRQNMLDVLASMARNPKEIAYIKAMTGINIENFTTTGGVGFRPDRQPEITTDPTELQEQIKGYVKSRREFYGALGISERKLDTFPMQFLLEGKTRFYMPETTGFFGQKQVMDFFNPNAAGIRDEWGRFPDMAPDFALSRVDVVSNVRRFHEAQIRAMSGNLQKEIDRQGLKGGGRRISELDELSKAFENEGEARKAAQAPYNERINALDRDKGELAPVKEKIDPLVTKINQLYEAEGRLRQALLADFPTAYSNAADARTAIDAVLRRTGTSILLRGGVTITSLVDAQGKLDTDIRTRESSLLIANPKPPDESQQSWEKRWKDHAKGEADLVSRQNEINDNRKKLDEILGSIDSAERAVEQARSALAPADAQNQAAEEHIALMQQNYGIVTGYDKALLSYGAPVAGLDETSLTYDAIDQSMSRINTVHETAITSLTAVKNGFNIHATATGAPNAAAAAAAVGGIPGIWTELIDAANAAAAAGGATPTSVAVVVEAAADTFIDSLTSKVGWPESENNRPEKRRMVLLAKANAYANQLEQGDPQRPSFDAITLSNAGITEQQLRVLPIDESTQLIIDKINAGAVITTGGKRWTAADVSSGTYRPQIEEAIKFAQKRASRFTSALQANIRAIDSSKALEEEKKNAVDISEPKKRIDMTKAIAERQEQIYKTIGDIIERRADYTNTTDPIPADFSDAEKTLPNVSLAYIRFANIFSGHMSKTGAARDAAFREFYKFLPPDEMMKLLMDSFGITEYVAVTPRPQLGTVPPPATAPITTFGELMGEIKGRIDQKDDSVSEFNLIRGFTRTINTLVERVKPRR